MLGEDFTYDWTEWYRQKFCSICDYAYDEHGLDICGMDDNPHNVDYCIQQEHACKLFDLMEKQWVFETTPEDPDEPLEVILAKEKEFDEITNQIDAYLARWN